MAYGQRSWSARGVSEPKPPAAAKRDMGVLGKETTLVSCAAEATVADAVTAPGDRGMSTGCTCCRVGRQDRNKDRERRQG